MEDLKRVLREEGLDPEAVELVEVESDEQAEREHFPGSPTIRIDGEDAVPLVDSDPVGLTRPADSAPWALTPRVAHLRDGRPSPTPAPADLRAAVRRAA